MKAVYKKQNGRDKAFIGAIVGTVANIAGGIISGKKKKKAEQLAFDKAQTEQNELDALAASNAMNSAYANQGYVDDYKSKIVLQNGGKVKRKVVKSGDRIAHAKRYAAGGRKKANLGSIMSGIKSDFQNIGNEFKGANLTDTLKGIGTGVSSALAPTLGGVDYGSTISAGIDMLARPKFKAANGTPQLKAGGKKKALLGIGDAIGGIGKLVGAATQKVEAPKTINRADPLTLAAPKTQITPNSYQVDATGQPIMTNPITGMQDGLELPEYQNGGIIKKKGRQDRSTVDGDRIIYGQGISKQVIRQTPKGALVPDYREYRDGTIEKLDPTVIHPHGTKSHIKDEFPFQSHGNPTQFIKDVPNPKRRVKAK